MCGKKRVAVIFGGQSSEHEVSRFSAQSIIENLDKNKYDVVMIGITREGKWLTYEGPVEKLATGEWEAIAESKCNSPKSLAAETCGDSANIDNEIEKIRGENKPGGKYDVIFPVLHGTNGEDGTIQGLFELAVFTVCTVK